MPRAPTLTVTLDGGDVGERTSEQDPCGPALVLMWSEQEPGRIGELIFAERLPTFFGRDTEAAEVRAALVRQRPGRNELTAPPNNAFLSRRHLKLKAVEEDGIALECTGKRPLLVNGKEQERAVVRPGDWVELRGLYAFSCVERSRRLPDQDESPHPFGAPDLDGFVGESSAAWELRRQVAFAAQRAAHVLVTGPSGTGKELVARGVHRRSGRAARPLVSRSAATLPSGLIDAELFGNIANYPNVGMPERPGLLGQAHGSTLFLDEIGELLPELQAHLLRVLDGGEYQRLGDARPRLSDVRLVAATNRSASDLKPDLAARFTLRIETPSLAERSEDVPLLARHIVQRIAQADPAIARRFLGAEAAPRFAVDLIRALSRHPYGTHVRELEGFLWRSLQGSPGDTLELTAELASLLRAPAEPRAAPTVSAAELRDCLSRHDGVKDRVWRELGLSSRHALHRLMKKLGVDGEAD
ncbi:MAG: Response regulator of zinc sigma-54-dependent two-component system [Polyangiaceae bacterium]|jgi:two-component system nitrogen regulation response regulator GlnG/two-component system response regulator HydG|nr:Response regulator of zinc sigma-54-dependent two-component system [Polyangiaceae bacterium]